MAHTRARVWGNGVRRANGRRAIGSAARTCGTRGGKEVWRGRGEGGRACQLMCFPGTWGAGGGGGGAEEPYTHLETARPEPMGRRRVPARGRQRELGAGQGALSERRRGEVLTSGSLPRSAESVLYLSAAVRPMKISIARAATVRRRTNVSGHHGKGVSEWACGGVEGRNGVPCGSSNSVHSWPALRSASTVSRTARWHAGDALMKLSAWYVLSVRRSHHQRAGGDDVVPGG